MSVQVGALGGQSQRLGAFVIAEQDALCGELLSKYLVLTAQVLDHFLLLAVTAGGESNQRGWPSTVATVEVRKP